MQNTFNFFFELVKQYVEMCFVTVRRHAITHCGSVWPRWCDSYPYQC